MAKIGVDTKVIFEQILLPLLRHSLNSYAEANCRNGFSDSLLQKLHNLNGNSWSKLVQIAKEQTISGILYSAICDLPDEICVPDSILFELIATADRIERENHFIEQRTLKLMKFFDSHNLKPIVLKGREVAKFYPNPYLRECGDIDLYFEGEDFEKATELVARSGRNIYHSPDGSIHYSYQKIENQMDTLYIDQHKAYYDLATSAQQLPQPSSNEATLLMLSSHIMKHCIGAGVGLRQICDIALAYRALDGQYNKAELVDAFRKSGTLKFNYLLTSFVYNYLGINESPFDEKEAADARALSPLPLLKIIEQGGNFGHHESTRKKALKKSSFRRKLNTFTLFAKRLPFSLKYAPKEALSTILKLGGGNLTKI